MRKRILTVILCFVLAVLFSVSVSAGYYFSDSDYRYTEYRQSPVIGDSSLLLEAELFAAVFSLAVAVFVSCVVASKTKKIKKVTSAASYLCRDSVQYTERGDLFLHSTVTKVRVSSDIKGKGPGRPAGR